MANSIQKAIEYVNNQEEVLRMFDTYLLCVDLLKEPLQFNGKTISYDSMSFADYTMGSYDRRNGVAKKDFTFERKNRELTQDRGDSLDLDIADQNEAQIAGGIARVYNFYYIKVVVPTIDKYVFGKLAGVGNGAEVSAHNSLSSANILDALFGDFAKIRQHRIKTEECLVYMTASAKALVDIAAFGKGVLTVGQWRGAGNWDGDIQTTSTMIKGAKIVEVPDEYLNGASWVIVHPLAFDLYFVLGITDFFDRVPGHPGLAQVDVRNYFDAWVQPNGELGILVGLEKPRDLAFNPAAPASFDTSLNVKLENIEEGAKVYYTLDGSTPSSASTEYTSAGIALSATKTIKAIQIVNGVSSDVASGTFTKN